MRTVILILFTLLCVLAKAQQRRISHGPSVGKEKESSLQYQENWKVNPFDQNVFVENRGQFDHDIPGGIRIFYEASLGDINIYFTATGLIYRYCERAKKTGAALESIDHKEHDQEEMTMKMHFSGLEWIGSSPSVTIEALNKQNYYYTYAKGLNETIKTDVFKKIIYHNLYPGIDAEFIFPEGKDGFKYSLVVAPGAEINTVKLKHTEVENIIMNATGDVIINSKLGAFTEHAPVSYYRGDEKKLIGTGYEMNNEELSFSISEPYDKNKTIIIDPWITNPAFTGLYNRAYDLDYDNNGNVYVYGSRSPYQLIKLNSFGVIQWKFNALAMSSDTNMFGSVYSPGYGDFAVDKVNGTSYVVEGYSSNGGAKAIKVSTAGSVIATFNGNPVLNEMWRAEYNPCNRKLVVAAGGTNSPNQACILDTNMLTATPVNVLGVANSAHDMVLLAIDPLGTSCFMASARNCCYALGNMLVKLPVPSLSPTTFMVPSGYNFLESSSVSYVLPSTPAAFVGSITMGMNGMAVSPNWLYMYDGYTLKQVNKATGALNASNIVSPPALYLPGTSMNILTVNVKWGGLDVDDCDNVYAGHNKSINVHNSSLAITSTIVLPDLVFDVTLGRNYKTLYACGVGFVTSIDLPSSGVITKAKTATASCQCNGTATSTLMLCGNAATGIVYNWSNGQTSQTATGLCPGTYTVSTGYNLCAPTYQDTVTIFGNGSGIIVTATQTAPSSCGNNNGAASANPANGSSPYTFLWSNGQTSQTGTGLFPGNYTVTVTDAGGCSSIANVTITKASSLTAEFAKGTSNCTNCGCKEWILVNAAGGTSPYSYTWPDGYVNKYKNQLCPGNYTVNIKDKNGCNINVNLTAP